MTCRSFQWRLTAFFAACGLLAASGAPAEPPNSWPLGHHDHDFVRKNLSKVRSSGWDPARESQDDAQKAALTSLVSTFPVGMRDGDEPSDKSKTWQGNSSLDVSQMGPGGGCGSAGCPTVSLSGVSGTVYLLDDYNFPSSLTRVGNAKVAIVNSSMGALDSDGDGGTLFMVDSLIDKPGDGVAGIRTIGSTVYVMYSEILGGTDVIKTHGNAHFYRVHGHGIERLDGAHSDGIQSSSCNNCSFIESNLDSLFRESNGGAFINTKFGSSTNWFLVRNLLSGGQNNIRVNTTATGGSNPGGAHTNFLVYGNRFLGVNGNTSWGIDGNSGTGVTGGSGLGDIAAADDNVAIDGSRSGVDHAGRPWNTNSVNGRPPTSSQVAQVEALISDMETWTSQIRAAAGYSTSAPPPAAPPPPSSAQSPSGIEPPYLE